MTQRELPPPHTLHLAWGPGRGRGLLSGSTLLPSTRTAACSLALLALLLLGPLSVLTLFLVCRDPLPAGVVCLRGHCPRCLTQAYLCQEKTGPPSPGHRALPCRTVCSLIYEGQAGTGPSDRQREVGTEENVRTGRGCGRPDPIPASRKLAKEGGEGHPLQGQAWVSMARGL